MIPLLLLLVIILVGSYLSHRAWVRKERRFWSAQESGDEELAARLFWELACCDLS